MNSQIKVFIEDSIMQKNEPATAGSKVLAGFQSPFDAAVVEKLDGAGVKIEKRLMMDEFGIDDLFSDDDVTLAAIREAAADKDVCVLCSDIFGKVRRQAALHGLSYIRPTYGTVSRYGLIPAAASMDQIGIVCSDAGKGFEILAAIAGIDERDGAMAGCFHVSHNKSMADRSHVPDNKAMPKTLKVAIPENVWGEADAGISGDLGKIFDLVPITLDYFDAYHQVLCILSMAEISNNTNRYDGIKFGYRSPDSKSLNELYLNTRSEGFTLNTKLAIIIGAYVLAHDNYLDYYEKAMKIRRLVKESVTFDAYDVIALPVQMKGKPKYEQSALYALTALAGLPSLTVPFGDAGIQFVAGTMGEDILAGIMTHMYSVDGARLTG